MKRLLPLLALAAALCAPLSVVAQTVVQTTVKVVGTCGTAVYTAGKMAYPTISTTGLACGSVTVTTAPTSVTTTDKGGTVTTGGTAQAAIALNASRKYWCVMNGPAETETMYVRVNGTASATTGTPLQPGQQACTPPGVIDTAAVSVLAATTGHRWYGFEDQ